jgi:PLD-like domain
MIKLLTDDLWSTLSKRSKKTKVAVAYFDTGASKQLRSKKGDSLIVAMALGNVISGQTNPFEIEKLVKKGVQVFNLPNLHSKVFIFDDTVIVGSSNVSTRSKSYFIETAISTDDVAVLKDSNLFIKANSIERIEQDYIEVCKPKYNPPKVDLLTTASEKTVSKFKGSLSRVFVISTEKIHWSDADYAAVNSDRAKFSKKVVNRLLFEVNEIKYDLPNQFINSVREGDILIEIETHKVKAFALYPKRALGVTAISKERIAFLRTEDRQKRRAISWSTVKTQLLKVV